MRVTRRLASITRFSSARLLALALSGAALAQTLAPAPVATAAPAPEKSQRETPAATPSCTDCRGTEAEN